MATNFPTSPDVFTNPTATDPTNSATVPHATQHTNLNDAVEAIENFLITNPRGVRELLTADRTYYVRTDGSNTNNGLANTAGGAFLTIQHGVNVAAGLDTGGHAVVVQAAAGTYAEAVVLPAGDVVGGGSCTLLGDATTPTNCVIDASAAFGVAITAVDSRGWTVKGFRLKAGGGGVVCRDGGSLAIGNLSFDSMPGLIHIACGWSSTVQIVSDYTIAGGAYTHIQCAFATSLVRFGDVNFSSVAVTLTGTPAWGFAFLVVGDTSVVDCNNWNTTTFTGASTGRRWYADDNAVILLYSGGTGINTFFPGDVDGYALGMAVVFDNFNIQTGPIVINTWATGNIGHIIQGVAGQSANLQQWKSNTTVLSYISADGAFHGPGVVSSVSKSGSALLTGDVTFTGGSNVTLTQSGQNITIATAGGGDVVSSSTNTFTVGPQTVQTGGAGNIGIIITGTASQSVDLQEWKDSGGVLIAAIGKDRPHAATFGDGYPDNIALITIKHGNTGSGASGIDLYNVNAGLHLIMQCSGTGGLYLTNESGTAAKLLLGVRENPGDASTFNATASSGGAWYFTSGVNHFWVNLPAGEGGSDYGTSQVAIGVATATDVGIYLQGATSQSGPMIRLGGVSTVQPRSQMEIDTAWATSTDATRKARAIIRVYDTAAREALRCEADGARAWAGVPAGNSTAFARLGGTIFDHYADGASTHTDGTEDDLYSDTVPASTLATNGDKLLAEYCLVLAGHAISTDQIKAYFGGTLVLDSGANNFTTGGNADIWLTIIRESSSVVRVKAEFVPSGITLQPVVTYTRITGLTLTNTQILKCTGIATGTNSASGDITAKLGVVQWVAAAV